MKFPLIIQASLALSISAMSTSPLAADELFIDENFDVQNSAATQPPHDYEATNLGVTATRSYKEGVGVENSRAMVLSADFQSSTHQSLAAIIYRHDNVIGNENMKPEECFIEFQAKGSKPSRKFTIIVQGWSDPYFKGTGSGSLSSVLTLADTADFQTYRIPLDDASWNGTFDPQSKTYQITFQIFGSNWGNDTGNELIIDSIKIGRKTTP